MSADECHTESVGKVNLVELATGLLILGKFDEVYKLCQKGLAKCVAVTTTLEEAGCGSKNGIGNAHHHLDEENEASCRNSHIEKRKHRQKKPHFSDLMKECLCIIAVQALAEMNRWQDVLPFLQSQYGPVQQLPAKLVQLCMLLHVHINKHQEAEVLYKQYSTLSTKKISSEQHTQLTELLFSHVLFPQEKWTEAAKVIESDCILRTDKKLALLKVLKEKERCQKRESGSIVSQSIVEDTEPLRENRQGNVLFLMASKVSLFFYRWIPKTYWNHLSSLAMVGICTYLVLRHNSAQPWWWLRWCGFAPLPPNPASAPAIEEREWLIRRWADMPYRLISYHDISSWQSYTAALWLSITRLWQNMFSAYYKMIIR